MKRCLSLIAVGLVIAAFVGCHPGAGSLTDQDKAAIRKVVDEATKTAVGPKADWGAYVDLYYAPDAKVLVPNMPTLEGRDAIRTAFVSMGVVQEEKFDIVSLEGRDDLAWVHGTYAMTVTPPGSPGPVTDKGKYIEVWQKQADGTWKAIRDIWNSDMPAPGLILPMAAIKADAGPELKALDWLAGRSTWETEAKVASVFGPPGKSSLAMDCRWFAGGQHLFCTVDGSTPTGIYHDLMVYSYDPEAKAYRGFDIDNTGMATQFGITVAKDTWTMLYDLKAGGKPVKMRMTLANMTADGCTFKQEVAAGGGPFSVVSEGKGKKLK